MPFLGVVVAVEHHVGVVVRQLLEDLLDCALDVPGLLELVGNVAVGVVDEGVAVVVQTVTDFDTTGQLSRWLWGRKGSPCSSQT